MAVNGSITLGENIADNGGLKHAYGAYQMWKANHPTEKKLLFIPTENADQLFFMEYAHVRKLQSAVHRISCQNKNYNYYLLSLM